ncbi:hypothetical protein [Mycobacterium sp. OTB74]|jgi:hypothetical protein|uniref:hypothetical protein n=1 Tax=Mycobacterium sp. OTB74 TaxID=1853452 RepID=UPI002477226F|nr:hypothetical protein [Mycobacterium sp. OTB74]MDH6246077.1 hypothetical protein [Mycobacterium sp. OTB74]
MENDEQEDVAHLREWIGRLEAFSGALEDLEGESPSDFCESACDAWKNIAMTDSPPPTSPAVLVITESFAVLTRVMTKVSTDWADTPDVRDRLLAVAEDDDDAVIVFADVVGGVGGRGDGVIGALTASSAW